MVEPADLHEALDELDRLAPFEAVAAAAAELVFDKEGSPYPPPHHVWERLRDALVAAGLHKRDDPAEVARLIHGRYLEEEPVPDTVPSTNMPAEGSL